MQECSFIEDYKVHGLLGDGGQANVYLASKNQELFAIKVYFPGNSKEESFKKEVEFLSKLNFKHLINIVDSKIDGTVNLAGKPETTGPIIVLEFAEGGQLFEYIAKEGRIRPEVCRSLFKMLISAIEYMNSVGVTHRDLKPENVLFDKDFYLKVSDFGLSTLTEGHEGDGLLYTRLGTEGYKPPEMEQGKYTGLQADIFAAGVILFIIYTGTPPFLSTKLSDKIYKLIREKNFPKFWTLHEKKKPKGFYPDQLKRLFNSFFSAEPQQRPTFQSLREDEWLNGDQAMQNEISQQFRQKYAHMLEGDENKRKIEQAKIQIMQQQIMEEQNSCCGETRAISEGFQEKYNDLGISKENLPFSQKQNLIAINTDPSFAVAWLHEYLKGAEKQKQIFMSDACQQILPSDYSLEYDSTAQKVNLKLIFEVDDDFEEIQISGSLVQLKDNKVGIDWQKVKGNTFWLTSIISHLNTQLKVLS